MTVTPSSPTVGIFKDRSMAEQAIDALHTAGFTSEQVRYSAGGTSGSILADLKSLFTGQNTNNGNITNDLTDMGLSNEEAQYYSHEFTNGNTILAVLASGREQEALNILHQYGAYNTRTSNPSSTATYSQQPSDSTQQAVATPDDASLQQQSNIGDHSDEVAPYSDPSSQDNLPDDVSTTQQPEYQPTQPLAPGYHSTLQVTPAPNLTTPASTSNTQATPLEQTTPSDTGDTGDTDSTPELQNTQPDTASSNPTSVAAPSDTETTDSTPGSQNTFSATATSEPTDEFQQLQEQLQAAQQQLQDAKTQLQAAKEHEAQIQTIREREQKLQVARQQLQDIQAQLQATLAELHETQGRLSQYK